MRFVKWLVAFGVLLLPTMAQAQAGEIAGTVISHALSKVLTPSYELLSITYGE